MAYFVRILQGTWFSFGFWDYPGAIAPGFFYFLRGFVEPVELAVIVHLHQVCGAPNFGKKFNVSFTKEEPLTFKALLPPPAMQGDLHRARLPFGLARNKVVNV